MDIKINNAKLDHEIRNISAFYSCGTNLDNRVTSVKNNGTSELIDFGLTKSGQLQVIFFSDKNGRFRQMYQTPDFIPASTSTISEFAFVENVSCKFKFSGQVFKRKYNLLHQNESIQIDGNVDIKMFVKSICNIVSNFITLNNQIAFANVSRINQAILSVRYEAYSLNEYNINFINLNQNIPDLPIGTYAFTNLSQTAKIEFRKYTGIPQVFLALASIPSLVASLQQKQEQNIVLKQKILIWQIHTK